MNILNKSITILILSVFCVLSINIVSKAENNAEKAISVEAVTVEVTYSRPSSLGAKDGSITLKIQGAGPFKVIAVSNTSLGTITKEGGNTIVLDQLVAGFYKLYITDSEKKTTEYQVTID